MNALFTAIEFIYNTFIGFFGQVIAKILTIAIVTIIAIIVIAIILRIIILIGRKIKYIIVTRNMTKEEKYKYDQHHRR